jgi:aminopeptidase N
MNRPVPVVSGRQIMRCGALAAAAPLIFKHNMIRIFTLLIALGCSLQLGAYCSNAEAAKRRQERHLAKTSIASPLLEYYDLLHVRIDLELDNMSIMIGGNAVSTARVTNTAGLTKYVFELNDKLTIDSMQLNGSRATPVRLGTDLYVVDIPAGIPFNATFTAQVWYNGKTDNGTGFFTHGVNQKQLPSGTNIVFSLSDQFLAKDWWPCKQTLTDKVDSADLWFTVADSLKAGSNGLLQRVTPMSGNRSRYEWKTRYPIEYYLISFAAAPYASYSQTLHFSGSTDTMPVLHYIYDTASFNPQYKPALDSTPLIIDHFSGLFGRYPFWREKYGHCIAPLSGGMEHQTMTTLGAFSTPLIAHELGHQWWGDHVTYASWRDIWLSEGFASYCEQLFVEHFRGTGAAQVYRSDVFVRVMSGSGGSVYVDDTDNVSRIFDSRLTYDKGAAVAHMLRYMAPNDAAYFNGLRTYQQRYAFKLATTDSLKQIMEAAYGYRLDSFFRQWVYGEGYPVYTLDWAQSGSNVVVKLSQSSSRPGSVPLFDMRVPLRFNAGSRDTMVYANLTTADSLFRFSWNGAITSMDIDPEDQIVNRRGPITEVPGLAVGSAGGKSAPVVAPNPTDGDWLVEHLLPGQELVLNDASGRKVMALNADSNGRARINSSRLAPGMYTLSIPGESRVTLKLQRR